jgi:hypothetical protein
MKAAHSLTLAVLPPLILATHILARTPQQSVNPPAAQAPPKQTQPRTSKHTTAATKSLKYVNKEYGFTFSLPATWKGYSTVKNTWSGTDSSDGQVSEGGPEITIVNPRSTSEKPYQDIVIMVFSHAQWDSLQQAKFSIGAAAVGPGEIGRNRRYVFALPPRLIDTDNMYGWREVWKLLQSNPLHAF